MPERKRLYETITAENWGQGFIESGRRACLVGHARKLYWHLGAGREKSIYQPLSEAILVLFPDRIHNAFPAALVGDFNDHPDTTVEDVRRVCKLADV